MHEERKKFWRNPSYYGLAAFVVFLGLLLFQRLGCAFVFRGICMILLLLALVLEFFWPPHRNWQGIAAASGYFLAFLLVTFLMIPAPCMAREKARQIACLSNLRLLGAQAQEYAESADGWYPETLADCGRERSGNPDGKIWQCPSRRKNEGASYEYYGAGHRNDEKVFLLFAEQPENHPDGSCGKYFSDGTFLREKKAR